MIELLQGPEVHEHTYEAFPVSHCLSFKDPWQPLYHLVLGVISVFDGKIGQNSYSD